ncbi:MAG: hypothetical protein M3416_10720 [Acidobacteriota bacterium]|nr:hypothetical protein [Acidobacteriota bacterium]
MSTDLQELIDNNVLTLRVRGGGVAARLHPHPALALMAAKGNPPEGLLWGGRTFFLTPEGRYVEGLLYPLLGNEQLLG